MVSSAGRGRPRPLLAGVFRKACDYCVRSKRGCNGGTPCEQCVRRNQQCTYSQRRKSGPRGRPVRQHAPATDGNATPNVGTRISARKKTSSFMSPRLTSRSSTMPSTSSPSRTASMSSSSSEYSPSEESESETEIVSAGINDANVQVHVAKKGKISGGHVLFPTSITQQVSGPENRDENELVIEKETGTTPLQQGPSTPTAMSPKVSVTPSPEERAAAVQPCETVNGLAAKASWPQTLSKVEASVKLNSNRQPQEQQPQEERRSAANLGTSWSTGSLIHEISMQPWEISSVTAPRPVACDPALPGGSAFAPEGTFAAKPATKSSLQQHSSKATDSLPRDVDVYEAMDTTVVGATVTAADAAASAAGESSFGGALLTPCDDDEHGDFSLDLECNNWEIPSLTREMSLARAVEALGGEQQPSGFGYESW